MFSGKLSSDRNIDWKTNAGTLSYFTGECGAPGTPGHGVTFCYPVPLDLLLRGPCHFGPSCAEKTTALKLVLLLWIVDTVSDSMTFVMEYAFDEAIRNPMDNGLTNQSPPPTLSITIDNTFGVPMVWCQARWRLQLLRRWLLCKSCILGHFYGSFLCFRELWFYSFVVLYLFGLMHHHLKILHSAKMPKYSLWVFNINYKDVTLNVLRHEQTFVSFSVWNLFWK